MRKPHPGALALMLIALIVLAGCGGGTPSTNAPGASAGTPATGAPADVPTAPSGTEPVTITWGFWGSPEEKASHERVAAAFEASHPGYKIVVWHQPWDEYFTKLKTLWASGDASQIPDVLFLWPTPSYAATGVLADLTPFIEQSSYDLNDYWPALLESGSYDGKVYGLPRDIGVEVLYYNKTIFDEVGHPYPTEQWTWDDLRGAAQKLSIVEANGRVKRYGLAIEGGKWSLWVNQNKGTILDDMRNPSKCTLTEPAATQAIGFFADLLNNKAAIRDADLSQAGGDAAVFQSGQAAMIIQNSSRVSAFNQAGASYDVVPVPIPSGGQRSATAGGAAWAISEQSDNKQAAWTFLSWLQSAEGGEKLYTEAGEIFPALQSVAKSEAFLKSGQPPVNRQAFLTEGENARVGRFGYFADWNELSGSIIDPGLQSIWAGEAQPADVLPQLCQQVDAFLQEKGYPKP
ncbi:MAG TPA: sugar ABC transporter substrate-binding protein [Roseiflexaceae bacterium]|nr:sugar ABC transporter substrate-binding protein [Roseiflexaceae bacterium]